jgi:hypothetical protein
MSHHDIPELDGKGLRNFGLTFGAIVGGLFGLVFPLILGRSMPVWPWVIFTIFSTWAVVAPESLRPVYVAWMRFGLLMSRITTPLIMGLVFFLVVTPSGLLRRWVAGDVLTRQWDHNTDSYRIKSKESAREHVERPY